MTSKPV